MDFQEGVDWAIFAGAAGLLGVSYLTFRYARAKSSREYAEAYLQAKSMPHNLEHEAKVRLGLAEPREDRAVSRWMLDQFAHTQPRRARRLLGIYDGMVEREIDNMTGTQRPAEKEPAVVYVTSRK